MLSMRDIDLKNKTVMIREDFNVPMVDGKITSDARVQAAIPTIQQALDAGAKVVLLSHLGRPEEGEFSQENSLLPVSRCLSQLLHRPVPLVKDWLQGVDVRPGEVVLCENVRFNVGEKKNSPELAKKLASMCDVFVMDAFATAHRAEASTCGVAEYAPIACGGPLLIAELEALSRALQNPSHPLVALVGGAKVSTKLHLLESLMSKVDVLLLGGGILNTFLAEAGLPIGKSLYEKDLMPEARRLMELAKTLQVQLPLAEDVVVATAIGPEAPTRIVSVNEVQADEMILDLGPLTIKKYCSLLDTAKTILWNGPVGVFEYAPFAQGTQHIAETIGHTSAFSLAGGGDTISAIDKFQIADNVSYISTGGGAFLEYVEGKVLPAVAILEQRAREQITT